jgi:hypothetical protein
VPGRRHARPALATSFDQYVFGHDRAALLTAQLPATAAGHAEAHARQHAHWRAELARIDTAERALIAELEQPADPQTPPPRPTAPASANATRNGTPNAPTPKPS